MQRNSATDKQIGRLLWRIRNSPIREILRPRIEHRNGMTVDYRFLDVERWMQEHLSFRAASDLITRIERDSFVETIEYMISIGFPIEHPNPKRYGNPEGTT